MCFGGRETRKLEKEEDSVFALLLVEAWLLACELCLSGATRAQTPEQCWARPGLCSGSGPTVKGSSG